MTNPKIHNFRLFFSRPKNPCTISLRLKLDFIRVFSVLLYYFMFVSKEYKDGLKFTLDTVLKTPFLGQVIVNLKYLYPNSRISCRATEGGKGTLFAKGILDRCSSNNSSSNTTLHNSEDRRFTSLHRHL